MPAQPVAVKDDVGFAKGTCNARLGCGIDDVLLCVHLEQRCLADRPDLSTFWHSEIVAVVAEDLCSYRIRYDAVAFLDLAVASISFCGTRPS